jgi:hypothetical protein
MLSNTKNPIKVTERMGYAPVQISQLFQIREGENPQKTLMFGSNSYLNLLKILQKTR